MKKRIINIISYAVVGLLVILLGFILISNLSGNVTFVLNRAAVWVITDSMENPDDEPNIPARSYVLIEKAAAADVQVGDVILFVSSDPALNGAHNLHRVVRIEGDHAEFVTKGTNKDHNLAEDKYTAKAENVIGIYRRNLPVMSFFGRLMASGTGIALMVLLVTGVFAVVYVPDMIQASKARKAKKEREKKEQFDELVRLEIEKMKQAASENKDAKHNE